MLSCQNLTLMKPDSSSYIFCELAFSMLPGSLLYIIGPNGCGKTSLFKAIAGLKSYHGSITFYNQNFKNFDFTPVNYIGHNLAINVDLTVLENIKFWADSLNGTNALMAAISFLNLAELLSIKCINLSSGMLKKIALTRLFFSNAPIWLLDEIHVNLDKQNTALLQNLIDSKISSGGIVLISSHTTLIYKPKFVLDLEDFAPKFYSKQYV